MASMADIDLGPIVEEARRRILEMVYPLPGESLNERDWARLVHDDLRSMPMEELNDEVAQLRLRLRLDPESTHHLWLSARAVAINREIEERRTHGLG